MTKEGMIAGLKMQRANHHRHGDASLSRHRFKFCGRDDTSPSRPSSRRQTGAFQHRGYLLPVFLKWEKRLWRGGVKIPVCFADTGSVGRFFEPMRRTFVCNRHAHRHPTEKTQLSHSQYPRGGEPQRRSNCRGVDSL